MKKTNGILCPISSLPSKTGVGDFGYSAYEFIKRLKKCGIKYWQILPLNPLDHSNSPYSSICGSAFDEIYVSLELLKEEGYIKSFKNFEKNINFVDYVATRKYKNYYLEKAYKNKKYLSSAGFLKFLEGNSRVKKFALYKIFEEKNKNVVPYLWKKKYKEAFYNNEYKLSKKDEKKYNYYIFVQFILSEQFNLLKEKLKENEILLIGDLPFYVGLYSVDFIANLDNFKLDEFDRPTCVAGVPPDYFSKTGQLWGNPIYDFDYMETDNYSFYLNRIKNALSKFDILRIDHFRALDTYYEIPFGSENAINGKWVDGPGHKFLNLLKEENLLDKIIAEDLGQLFPSTLKLRDDFNIPGMNVLQFTVFDKHFEKKENQIIYTGTHDNDTTLGFYKSLPDEDKEMLSIVFRYENVNHKYSTNYKFIDLAMKEDAFLAIIPIWDYLELNSKFRMNTPGTSVHNWEFKLKDFKEFDKKITQIKNIIEINNR